MISNFLNRTVILWAGALAIALIIVNPREALIQRVNQMSIVSMDCLSREGCADNKAVSKARLYYAILSELYPRYGRGAEMEGLCDVLLHQDNSAIKKFHEALKQNPNLFWVDFELGKALYRSQKYPEALKYFQMIIAQDNDALFEKAVLSRLHQATVQLRTILMYSLIDFVSDIKLKSYQLAVGCQIHQGEIAQADQARLAEIDSLAFSRPVFHPWGHVIEPLKEAFFNN